MILTLVAILSAIVAVVASGISIVDFMKNNLVSRRGIITVITAIAIIALVLTFVTQQTSASSTPSQQAQALLSQYYSDINTHQYQDAYNLLGSKMQRKQSYNNFVIGYAHTFTVTFTIDIIEPQNDGSVIVTLTLTAKENANSGTKVSTYQGTVTIGQENGKWKILIGNFY